MIEAASGVITPTTTALGAGAGVLLVIYLAVVIFVIAGVWKTFEKAGLPGWGSIVPIYNLYLLTKMAKQEWWVMLLLFIPLVGIVVAIMLAVYIAQNFNKSVGFGIGLAFLGFIFYPILGFGDGVYSG
jgi:hypothetical protein